MAVGRVLKFPEELNFVLVILQTEWEFAKMAVISNSEVD